MRDTVWDPHHTLQTECSMWQPLNQINPQSAILFLIKYYVLFRFKCQGKQFIEKN